MTKFYSPVDATERILANGRPVAPGETFELKGDDLKDPHNKRLIEEGQILEIKKASTGGDDQ